MKPPNELALRTKQLLSCLNYEKLSKYQLSVIKLVEKELEKSEKR